MLTHPTHPNSETPNASEARHRPCGNSGANGQLFAKVPTRVPNASTEGDQRIEILGDFCKHAGFNDGLIHGLIYGLIHGLINCLLYG